jgi:hypothetical protein
MVLAIVLAVVLVFTLKPWLEDAFKSSSSPDEKRDHPAKSHGSDPSFVTKDEGWRELARAYGLSETSTADQRTDFVKAIYRELRPEAPPPADLGGNTPPDLPEAELLLAAATNPGSTATAQSVSKHLVDSVDSKRHELKQLAAAFPDRSAAAEKASARVILVAWWNAFRVFHDQQLQSFEEEAKEAWKKLAAMEPVPSIPFLTPKDVERLAVMSNFLSIAVGKQKSGEWLAADWHARVAILKELSSDREVDSPRRKLFGDLVRVVPVAGAEPGR